MQFEWKITSLTKKTTGDLPGTVVDAQWIIIGTDENGKAGFFRGGCDLGQPSVSDFIDFDSLTEQQVLNWVQDIVELDMEHVEQQIQLDIKAQDFRKVFGSDLPWAPPVPTVPVDEV